MIGRLTEDLCRPRLRSVGSGALGHRLCQTRGAAEPPCRPIRAGSARMAVRITVARPFWRRPQCHARCV